MGNSQKHPGETASPWLQRKEWAHNRIRSNARGSVIGLWVVAVFWNSFAWPILMIIPDELEKQNYPVLIVALFPLAGLFVIRQAWKQWREWKRYGVVEVELDPFPGALDGHVGGRLAIKGLQPREAEFRVELECVYSHVSGRGKNRSRRQETRWHQQGTPGVRAAIEGVELEFRFDVPAGLPESDVEDGGNYHFWRFRVCADTGEVNFQRDYQIPVFATGRESQRIRHDVSAEVEQRRDDDARRCETLIKLRDFHQTALGRAFRFRESDGVLHFYYPMFRNRALTFFSLFFAVCFGFAVYQMAPLSDNSAGGIAIMLFSLPFVLVAAISTIAALYLPLNNLSVRVSPTEMVAIRRIFLLPVRYNRVDSSSISAIDIKSSGSSGSGARKLKYFRLIARTEQRKSFTIAEGLEGEDPARLFRDFLLQQIGRRSVRD